MKKIVRAFLKKFGYDIVKTDDWYAAKKTLTRSTRLGNYDITMPGNNTLLRTYALYPDFNSILGRLAAVIAKKYPGMTVIDIGANVGDTIAIIKSFVDTPVIGIEGDDVSFHYLETNARQFKDVTIVKTYVGDKRQEIKADLGQVGANTTIIPSEKGSNSIAIRTLDEVLEEERFTNVVVKLLKLDIEGFDTIALRGAYGLTKRSNPVLFFEYNPVNMKNIGEDGLSTIYSFEAIGYSKLVFFDHKGNVLLVTNLRNREEIASLHNYALKKENELGHYDICLFHRSDDDLAQEFLQAEEKGI